MGNMVDDFERLLKRIGVFAGILVLALIGAAYVLGRFTGGAQ